MYVVINLINSESTVIDSNQKVSPKKEEKKNDDFKKHLKRKQVININGEVITILE